MFFTIISRIPFFLDNQTNKKYLYIYVIGAICYLIVHFYLFSCCTGQIATKIKSFIYYIIICDLVIAFLLDKILNRDKNTFVNGIKGIQNGIQKELETLMKKKNKESDKTDKTDSISNKDGNISRKKRDTSIKYENNECDDEKCSLHDKHEKCKKCDKSNEDDNDVEDNNDDTSIPKYNPTKKDD